MGFRGELFTTSVQLDNRTYFFNIKENRAGDVFLQVVESKNVDGSGFDRHAIVIFEDDMQKFLQGLESSLQFIEKNKQNFSKKIVSTKPTRMKNKSKRNAKTSNPNIKNQNSEKRTVRIIPKKKS